MRRLCPEWFQESLTRLGGTTPHGEPRFKLVWGESETMRDGGYFIKDGYEGYRDVPSLGGEACWAILMWEPAQKHGTARRWYRENTDEYSGLVTLGQYPYRGRYRLIRKLIHRELVSGEWQVTRMEPTFFILEVMVPLIVYWNKLSLAERLSVFEQEKEAEEREADRFLADARDGCRIRRGSPLVQKRMEQMERNMAQAIAIAARSQRGFSQALTGV